MKTVPEIRAKWLTHLLSTAPIDRPQAAASLRALYLASDLPPPDHFFWFDRPYDALWAMVLPMAAHDPLWISTAQFTASTTLANSASTLSPAELTKRPW
jgi:hypothetical protein